MKSYRKNGGYALVIVMCLTMILAFMLAGVIRYSDNEIRISDDQQDMEGALYVAQAGAERGASYVANGGTGPASFTGMVGEGSGTTGTYVLAIIPASLPSSAPRTLGGTVVLNPNNDGSSYFSFELADGTTTNSSAFANTNFPGYTGPAVWVHFLPGGAGAQNTLLLDGAGFQIQNSFSYDIFADCMSIYLFKDASTGKWKVTLASTCASFIVD